MPAPNTNKFVKKVDFRPQEAEDYYPEQDSALNAVHAQGHGSSVNERDQSDTRKHTHDGVNSRRIDVANLEGFIQTVSVVPTYEPKDFHEQFVIYVNGATLRLYIYDITNKAWRYSTLT